MSELETLRAKADRLAEVRRELDAIDETHKKATADLRNEASVLKEELLHEFGLLDLKSFKAGDGTGYTVSPVKSVTYDSLQEANVLKWAAEHNAVSLDKQRIKDLLKKGVELPEYIRIQESNTIRITKPKTE